MKPKVTDEVLRDLDLCRSLFDALEHILDHNSIGDYHSLAMLAQEGKNRIDGVIDILAQ